MRCCYPAVLSAEISERMGLIGRIGRIGGMEGGIRGVWCVVCGVW